MDTKDNSSSSSDNSQPARKIASTFRPDLTNAKVKSKGSHVGDRYVRIVRHQTDNFTQLAPNVLVASPEDADDRGPLGKAFFHIKRFTIGHALTNADAEHERLSNPKALAVLSSDALSSVAYGTEEILRVLLLAGVGALALSLPIGAAIVCLILIVGASYRQTIKAYPHGGGSYSVAKDNLGDTPALVAGSALLIDYVLTVAVSISSGVGAMVSAFPSLHTHLVSMGVFCIVVITLLNLRGIRESGSIFALPTYVFMVIALAMIAIGIVKNASEDFAVHSPSASEFQVTSSVTLFLILRAFSSGCSAMTGVEAISNGVSAFKTPEDVNARKTLVWMIGLLSVMFAGITFLAHQYGSIPMDQANAGYETVISQIAKSVFGGTNAAYYAMQFATMAILVLAANTAYADFPRLSFFMSKDGFLPSQFSFRGDRLAYSFGIITLGIVSVIVLFTFGGETERLIPLYAVGVFTSFTLSQSGMVMRWNRLKESGWQHARYLNGLGAIVTGIVAVVIGISKFTHGAWMVLVLIPVMVFTFRRIAAHYQLASLESVATTPMSAKEITHVVVVPIAKLNMVARQTLAYARSITPNVSAVHITDNEESIASMQERWQEEGIDVPLIIIESPYRSLVGPLVNYIQELRTQNPDAVLTVVLPEFVPSHWWEQILHNQTALRIKAALLFKPGIVVTSVPYHLVGSHPDMGWNRILMRRL